MKRPEILSPAGDLERLKFAVLYGADAVYVGATEFGMRSAPKNFTMEQLAEGVRFAHARGRRVYLTLNTVPTNEEIARMPDFMRRARETGVDAFIVADLGVLAMAKHIAPEWSFTFPHRRALPIMRPRLQRMIWGRSVWCLRGSFL
jgi:putative protease